MFVSVFGLTLAESQYITYYIYIYYTGYCMLFVSVFGLTLWTIYHYFIFLFRIFISTHTGHCVLFVSAFGLTLAESLYIAYYNV